MTPCSPPMGSTPPLWREYAGRVALCCPPHPGGLVCVERWGADKRTAKAWSSLARRALKTSTITIIPP